MNDWWQANTPFHSHCFQTKVECFKFIELLRIKYPITPEKNPCCVDYFHHCSERVAHAPFQTPEEAMKKYEEKDKEQVFYRVETDYPMNHWFKTSEEKEDFIRKLKEKKSMYYRIHSEAVTRWNAPCETVEDALKGYRDEKKQDVVVEPVKSVWVYSRCGRIEWKDHVFYETELKAKEALLDHLINHNLSTKFKPIFNEIKHCNHLSIDAKLELLQAFIDHHDEFYVTELKRAEEK